MAKRVHDHSWPICGSCRGHGVIDLGVLPGQVPSPGNPGRTCEDCLGTGRVHDPDWPRCSCGGAEDCPVCLGNGFLSPYRQELLAAGQITQACASCKGTGVTPVRASRVREARAGSGGA